jgi:hypothetical protein
MHHRLLSHFRTPFSLNTQAAAPEPGLTCGDVRRHIQEEHRRNMLYWLQAQFQAGRTVDDIGIQLAISSS